MATYPDPLNPTSLAARQKYDFTDPDVREFLKDRHKPVDEVAGSGFFPTPTSSPDVKCSKDGEVWPCKTVQRLRK